MSARPVAVSLVAFDGHPVTVALESIGEAGATHAEPAFIAGASVFSEEELDDPHAVALRKRIEAAGLLCLAVSLHMDCGRADAAEKLARRVRFTAALGARFLITNTARRERRETFLRTVAGVLPEVEHAGVVLAFENPGHGADDLLASGAEAARLLAAIGSPLVILNYDVGNTLTNSEGAIRPEADIAAALPLAGHAHLKDMTRADDRWRYAALGAGEIDYDTVFTHLRARPDLPLCVELPLRQVRRTRAAPVRDEMVPPLAVVRQAVADSIARVRRGLEA